MRLVRKFHFFRIALVIFSISGVLSQEVAQTAVEESDDRCIGETSCSSCISGGPHCSWCKQLDFKEPRCDRVEVLKQHGCPTEEIYYRGKSGYQVKSDAKFSDYLNNDLRDQIKAVQVRPQMADLQIRAGDAVTIPLSFRAARNYPLDVYYLMDLTYSMSDDKETLAGLGGDLANAMKNMTRNFRLGFGSFVDKPLMPFVNPARMENPCSAERVTCSPAYGFHHHLTLSKDTKKFTDRVRNATVSGNLDNAEGGLDALMQVLACKNDIGWATDSRKIVILASDGILHFAGDGKLAGAVRNNDVACHLDPKTGLYLKSNELDYPSLGQIDSLLLKNKVSVIFAVTKDRLEHYIRLNEVLLGANYVATLEEDSSNIIQLVRQGFKDIVSSVSFSDNAKDFLKIEYESTCNSADGQILSTKSCEHVEEGMEYKFYLTFNLEKCPSDPQDWKQKVKIEERGLVSGLEVNVELLCGCDCEQEKNSLTCGGHGDLNCGTCACHDGWYGPSCSCSERNATSIAELDAGCLSADDALQGVDLCWGRGDCLCGQCECNGAAYGRYCECDDTLCGDCGPHGRCVCSRCQCDPGWEGRTCSCSSAQETCIAPGDTKPCNGEGKCECGKCVCNIVDGSRRTGLFCEKCDTCKGLCSLYRPCVHCKVFGEECPEDETVNPCFTNSSSSYLDIVRILKLSEDLEEELCKFEDENGCIFQFSYHLDKNRKVRLKVLDSKACTPKPNAAAIALGIIVVAVFLIGLFILLVWRSIVAAKDRYDYLKFVEATQKSNLSGMNPIYKPATRTYYVPQGFEEPQEPSTPAVVTPTSPSMKKNF
ncbi:integrin beta-PS-like [Neocloeon triangulifer]|uniref:integrin beta-PS-like n=1 Tax=Neocloeon triangulifer TaxID=2078957 RepID=UPI00286F64C5|nr:integrin beta-PS-like [Neocloeon triangulifer]